MTLGHLLARRHAVYALLLAVACGLAAGATLARGATASQAASNELSVALTGDIGSLDPAAWRGPEAAYIEYQMYDTLLRLDPSTNKIVPGLATSWRRVNPTTYVLQLRKGVTFWDGTPLTSADVVYSYQRALKKDVGAWNVPEYAFVRSYVATGPRTVTIRLKQPDNLLIPHLTGT